MAISLPLSSTDRCFLLFCLLFFFSEPSVSQFPFYPLLLFDSKVSRCTFALGLFNFASCTRKGFAVKVKALLKITRKDNAAEENWQN